MNTMRPIIFRCILPLTLLSIFILGVECNETTEEGDLVIKNATITSDVVSLRTNPVILASEIQFLHRGDEVKVIGRSTRPDRISGMMDYWYQVRLKNDIQGWVYGPNLSIGRGNNKQKSSEEARAALKEELERAVVGKWWEILSNGSTGYGRIYFWPDGVYKHGFGRGELRAQGKYTIDVDEMKVVLDKGSYMGEQLSMRKVGSEYRIYGKTKSRRIVLRRAFLDPDAPEPGKEHLEELDTDPQSDANKAGKQAAGRVK